MRMCAFTTKEYEEARSLAAEHHTAKSDGELQGNVALCGKALEVECRRFARTRAYTTQSCFLLSSVTFPDFMAHFNKS